MIHLVPVIYSASSGSEVLNVTESNSVRPPSGHGVASVIPSHPAGVAPVLLGKRQRDSLGSNMTGIAEDGTDDELLEDDSRKEVVKPARKRARTSNEPSDITDQRHSMEPASGHLQDNEEETPASSAHGFTIFRGPSELSDHYLDHPPPINPLPDLFPPPLAGAGSSHMRQGATSTSSANASENQQPFSFSFFPMSSTPAHSLFTPSFPYPEPPQSPSPAGINPSSFFDHLRGGERADIFQPFGFPNPSRPSRSRLGSNMGEGFVDPAALTHHIPDHDSEPNAGSNMTTGSPEPTPSSPEPIETIVDVPLMKRTMYGTELDGDTRFGDFGVEGVGSNGAFWAGGRY